MVSLPPSKTPNPRPITGWPLRLAAVELSAGSPSFLAFLHCASTIRRQAIFVALATLTHDGPECLAARLSSLVPSECCGHPTYKRIADALMAGSRARDIVHAVFNEVPEGLLGVLNRIGDNPLPRPRHYYALFDLHSDPQHRARRDVLRRRKGPITATQIEIVSRLDPILVHENILNRLYEASQADDANAALALIRETVSSATDESLRQSIVSLGDKTDLATFFNRWLSKMDRLPVYPPIPDSDPDVAVMASGEEMSSLGRRFRNCSTTRIAYAAQGAEVLLEWKQPPGLVAQCHRLTNGGWVLTEIHAKGNGRVAPTAAAAFRRRLEALGIPALSPGSTSRASGVLTLLGTWGGIGNNLGFDDEADDLEDVRDIAEVGNAA